MCFCLGYAEDIDVFERDVNENRDLAGQSVIPEENE